MDITEKPDGHGRCCLSAVPHPRASSAACEQFAANWDGTIFGGAADDCHGICSTPLIHAGTVDLLPLFSIRMPGVRFLGHDKEPSFRHGESYQMNWQPPDGWGDLKAVSLEVRPTMIIYDDCMVIGDPRGTDTVFGQRQRESAAIEQVLQDIRAVPRDAASLGMLQARYEEAARVPGPRTDQLHQQSRLAKQFAEEVERLGWERIKLLVPLYERRAELLRAQSQRKGGSSRP